ncbi:hypothetical protein [Methylobacterium sp. A54F]
MVSSRPLIGLIALGLAAGGCSTDVNPLRYAAEQTGGGPKPVTAPDFVAGSRRAGPEFLPVGVSAPPRPVRAKSSEGQKALESELEGARSRNEARGRSAEGAGRAAKSEALRPAQAPPAPATAPPPPAE